MKPISRKTEQRPSLAALPARNKRAPLTRSEMMGRIRSKNTKPETLVRSALHQLGHRFRNHARDLPGKPDLINRRRRWAVFVHGCFWHSHEGCPLASKPRSNQPYWSLKLRGNIERDQAHCRRLQDLGFRVFTVWECETRDPQKLAAAVSILHDNIAPRIGVKDLRGPIGK